MAEDSWKDHSARVQVQESSLPSSIPPQTGLTFNVWYNKWSQGQTAHGRFVSPYRLEPALDAGVTYGDKSSNKFFCLYFAKGMCCLGKKCQYKHHVPEADDVAQLKSDVVDCFGREKFGDYRDDMGGVGSFRTVNKTLYIGGLSGSLNNKSLKAFQIEARIRFMFARLGELDRIRFVQNKNCAFVKYKHQTNAQFAKEAMSNQTLLIPSDKEWEQRKEGTGLLVKWANQDPDPAAKRREEEEQNKEALEIVSQLLKDYDKDHKLDDLEQSVSPLSKKHSSLFDNAMLQKLKKIKLAQPIAKISDTKESDGGASGLVDYPSSDE